MRVDMSGGSNASESCNSHQVSSSFDRAFRENGCNQGYKLTLVDIRSKKISTNALQEMRPDGAALTNYKDSKIVIL